MKIQILGTGCAKCDKLYKNTQQAVNELGINAELEKVTDITKIMSMGVMMTPALVVDGQVKMTGKASGSDEIKTLLG